MPVVPFLKPETCLSGDWRESERSWFTRICYFLQRGGLAIDFETGLTDLNEPWTAFYDRQTGETLIHLARLSGKYVLVCEALNLSIEGTRLADVFARFEASLSNLLQLHIDRHRKSADVIAHPLSQFLFILAAVYFVTQSLDGTARAGEPARTGLNDNEQAGDKDNGQGIAISPKLSGILDQLQDKIESPHLLVAVLAAFYISAFVHDTAPSGVDMQSDGEGLASLDAGLHVAREGVERSESINIAARNEDTPIRDMIEQAHHEEGFDGTGEEFPVPTGQLAAGNMTWNTGAIIDLNGIMRESRGLVDRQISDAPADPSGRTATGQVNDGNLALAVQDSLAYKAAKTPAADVSAATQHINGKDADGAGDVITVKPFHIAVDEIVRFFSQANGDSDIHLALTGFLSSPPSPGLLNPGTAHHEQDTHDARPPAVDILPAPQTGQDGPVFEYARFIESSLEPDLPLTTFTASGLSLENILERLIALHNNTGKLYGYAGNDVRIYVDSQIEGESMENVAMWSADLGDPGRIVLVGEKQFIEDSIA